MARKASRTTFDLLNDSLDELILKSSKHGFTIVELLIVIVVIAILAAITVVAHAGIRERANLSALQSELSGQARQLAARRAQNSDVYPTTLAAARTAGILNNTAGTEYTKYIVNKSTNPANYCATGVRGGVSYSVSSTSTSPLAGECVTNLVPNPSFEENTSSICSSGTTTARAARGFSGSWRGEVTRTTGDSNTFFFGIALAASTTYA